MDVSDRRMQVQLTQEARIASDFLYIRAILAVVGFVSALIAPAERGGDARYSTVTDLARLRGLSTSQPRRTAAW